MNSPTVRHQSRRGSTASTRRNRKDLIVYRGHVVSTADRVTTSHINGYDSVDSVPELWVTDANGRELRFSDGLLRHCRTGHEVMIVGDPLQDRIVALKNLSTGETRHSSSLNDRHVDVSHIASMVVLALISFVPIWFVVTFILFGEPSKRVTPWEQQGPGLFYGAWLLLAVLLPEMGRTRFNRRNEAMRKRIAKALEATA